MRTFGLPAQLLDDLLSAFVQDVTMTRDGAAYADMPALLNYCRRSANPVGRLLLHLYGVTQEQALRESDAICTALQLINFWQDLSVDIPRGRYYLPLAECAAHGIAITAPREQFAALRPDDERAARQINRARPFRPIKAPDRLNRIRVHIERFRPIAPAWRYR